MRKKVEREAKQEKLKELREKYQKTKEKQGDSKEIASLPLRHRQRGYQSERDTGDTQGKVGR